MFSRVTCPLAAAEQRELARGKTIGLARGHLGTVHDHGHPYDTIVDTSTATPAELAGVVLRREQTAGR